MDNYFTILGLDPAIKIDLENLSDQHKRLASESHPDNQGDEDHYKLINTAYAHLRTPSKRLYHLMTLHEIEYNKRGTVSNNLMDLFMSTAQILQDTDAFLRKKSATTSALGLALLEGESQQFQELLGNQIELIEQEQVSTLENTEDINKLEDPARDLAFLEKWQAQLKERYASLF